MQHSLIDHFIPCLGTWLAGADLQLQNGVTREFFLATCNVTFVALQVARKIASYNMALTEPRNQIQYK